MILQTPSSPVRAGARDWLGLAVLMLPVLLVSIDNTVLSFALPWIALDLKPSAAMQLWIVDVYPLVLAGLLVTMGNLGDRWGRRRLLLVGATGFAVVSVLAAFSVSAEMLLVARLLMGVFGAAIMPCTLSLIRGMFEDREQRRLAIAIWATGFGFGGAVGPIVGGLLLEVAPWGSVFLIAVPILVPLLALAPFVIRESRDPDPGPIDLPSIGLSMLALAPIVFAIKHVATEGVDLLTLGAAVLGIVAGVLFVRRLLRQRNPLLDVRLFAVPAFTGSVLVNLMSVVSLVGLLYFLSQHLQLVVGLGPLEASLVLVPGAALMMVAGLVVVRLVRRIRPAVLMASGLLLSGAAYLTIALAGASASVLLLGTAFAALSVGVGLAETLSNDIIIASVPPAKAGAASAVSETAYELGAVLGTSVMGGVLAAAYRAHLVIPSGVSDEAASAARETLAGALDAGAALPDAVGSALVDSARHAFDSGVVLTSFTGAALMVVAAVVALATVGRSRA
ncbi:MFS transporter [Cnuibacter physcomitrellae]|uniref:MFS transporter n=1 Tax=Cnuibacter physcomitrellae TaxID=1619308 RepID=A0A1X9LJD3_9MICO|nr:MFS transporter [Cnuibacter physcomitrellae]ARJ04031.1 MFS transporter [Cnuibacter physcomitrellae]GGI40077.1 MFS transporter [Cnuibacter physcomitrellae]